MSAAARAIAAMEASKQRGRLRLLSQKEHADARAGTLAEMRPRFEALRGEGAPAPVVADQLFQTPEGLAQHMAELADIEPGHVVLEPSAGLGRICRAVMLAQPQSNLLAVEVSPACCKALYEDGGVWLLKQADFLTLSPADLGTVDRVVMNPPFRRGLDVRHIRHAFDTLAPGGLLVALCYNGSKQNSKLKPWADSWEVLPDGTFKESNTGASVALLTKRKEA